MNIINVIVENWDLGCQVLLALIAIATLICARTPSVKDDSVVAKVQKIADWLSLVNPKAPKV